MGTDKISILGAVKTFRNTFFDERGYLSEWFNANDNKQDVFPDFTPKQLLFSQSKKGVVRGVHYSLAHEGQKKILTAISGKFLDILIDLRFTNFRTC